MSFASSTLTVGVLDAGLVGSRAVIANVVSCSELHAPRDPLLSSIFRPAYGSFISTISQTITNIGATPTVSVIRHNTATILRNLAYTGGESSLTVLDAGVYRFSYSVQFDKQGAGVLPVDIWIRTNSVDVPDSASQIVIDGNQGETFPYCEYILDLEANTKIEVCFYSTDKDTAVYARDAITGDYARPAIPGIISNIQRIA